MGQSVLTSQFVTGLIPELKAKVAGMEGHLDKLLTKARFEEAKLRDVTRERKPTLKHVQFTPPAPSAPSGSIDKSRLPRCHECGALGHKAYQCRKRGRGAPTESGPTPPNTVKALVTGSTPELSEKQPKVIELRAQLQQAEVDAALAAASVTMHGVRSDGSAKRKVGPVITLDVNLEGTPTRALVDTGSPVTLVSLKFRAEELARKRPGHQSRGEWKMEVEKRLKQPGVPLKNYGKGELNIVREIEVELSRQGHVIRAVAPVYAGAPVDVLLGTDVL